MNKIRGRITVRYQMTEKLTAQDSTHKSLSEAKKRAVEIAADGIAAYVCRETLEVLEIHMPEDTPSAA